MSRILRAVVVVVPRCTLVGSYHPASASSQPLLPALLPQSLVPPASSARVRTRASAVLDSLLGSCDPSTFSSLRSIPLHGQSTVNPFHYWCRSVSFPYLDCHKHVCVCLLVHLCVRMLRHIECVYLVWQIMPRFPERCTDWHPVKGRVRVLVDSHPHLCLVVLL